MQCYHDDPVVNQNGEPIPYATVTVYDSSTGAVSTIYSDNSGTALANPLTTDVRGNWYFYAADGRYYYTVTGGSPAITTYTSPEFELADLRYEGEQIANVKDYGAVGDGTTDDTVAIQAALDSLNTTRGGIVYFPVEGCTGSYKFGTLTMPAVAHGWITFLSDANWTITNEIDWLNNNTKIMGRSGAASVFWQGRPSFKIINGATLTNAIRIDGLTCSPPAVYATGIILENVSISGFVNGINANDLFLLTLRNVFCESMTGTSLIADGFFSWEIDGGTYVGKSDGSTPAISLLQSAGKANAVNCHFHDFALNYSGILMASAVNGGANYGFEFDNVMYENAVGTYAPFLTIGGTSATALWRNILLHNITLADSAGATGEAFIKRTGSNTVRGLFLSGFDPIASGPVTSGFSGSQLLDFHVTGNNGNTTSAYAPGVTSYLQYSDQQGRQAFSEHVAIGTDAVTAISGSYGSQVHITPPSTTTGLRVTVPDSFYSDGVRIQDATGNNLFSVDGDNGYLASALIKGSVTLAQLATPGNPVITNGGTAGSSTWGYKIVGKDAAGNLTVATAEGTTTTGNAALDATNYNILTWAVTPSATSYQVWLTTAPGGGTVGGAAAVTGLVATIPAIRENPYHSNMVYNHTTANGAGGTESAANTTGDLKQAASTYHNFGTTYGTSGYGLHDNAGTMQVKNSGGAWANLEYAGSTLSVGASGTTIKKMLVISGIEVDAGSIGTVSRGLIEVTVAGTPGIAAGDVIIPISGVESINDDLVFEGCVATDTDKITWYFYNPTGGAIDDAVHNWAVLWIDVT